MIFKIQIFYICLLKLFLASKSCEIKKQNIENGEYIELLGEIGKTIVLNKNFFDIFNKKPEIMKEENKDFINKSIIEDKNLYLIAKLYNSNQYGVEYINMNDFFPILKTLRKYQIKNQYKFQIYKKLINAAILTENIEDNVKFLNEKVNSVPETHIIKEIDFEIWCVFLCWITDAHYNINGESLEIASYMKYNPFNKVDSNPLSIKTIVFDAYIFHPSKTMVGLKYNDVIKLIHICLKGMFYNPSLKNQKLGVCFEGNVSNVELDKLKETFTPIMESIRKIKFYNIKFESSINAIFKNPAKILVNFIEYFPNLDRLDISFAPKCCSNGLNYVLSNEKIRKILSSLTFQNDVEITQDVIKNIAKLHSLAELRLYCYEIPENNLLAMLKCKNLHETLKDLIIACRKFTPEQTESLNRFNRLEKCKICCNP